ncbi:Uncharacterised protein [Sphingobacterium daejeonense]|nr:Uncharacterised protein [Sphingobacterium daejeonense]
MGWFLFILNIATHNIHSQKSFGRSHISMVGDPKSVMVGVSTNALVGDPTTAMVGVSTIALVGDPTTALVGVPTNHQLIQCQRHYTP